MIGVNSQPEIEAKIKTLDELIPLVKQLKAEGKTIVTNNGSYDIVHIGHVLGLFESKRQGDVLIIGVNSDKSVKAYKGPNRPINPEDMRIRMLAALSCIDYVFTFDEVVPMPWLEKIQPHVHTNGAEYGEECIEAETVRAHGGRIHLLPMIEGVKSSMLIEKILQEYGNEITE
ncbi:MAG TPA: adenylyltransferase/cytidyltransferase family protein [bacterium]|nr:adenylyltransferase/cytidyltransferase family protein [bacterium]